MTKLFTLMVHISLSLILFVTKASSQDNIFATPAPTPTVVQRYPTAEAFLAASKSGEIPEFFRKNHNGYYGTMFGQAAINILVKENGLSSKYLSAGPHTGMCGMVIQNLTYHEFNPGDQEPIRAFRECQENLPADLLTIFNKFAVQYDNAVKEYVAKVRLKENQVAEDRRSHEIDADTAKQVRKQKLSELLASPAYKQWESASQVQQGERMIFNAQSVLNHDDAVQRESGVTDLAARRAAGEQMVAGKSLVETAFGTYKKAGGKAATPSEVVTGPDPAADYR